MKERALSEGTLSETSERPFPRESDIGAVGETGFDCKLE